MNQKYLSDEPQDYHNPAERMDDFSGEKAAWNLHANRLAGWAMERMVVRPDAYLGYYRAAGGEVATAKRDGPVTIDLLRSHFAATNAGSLVG